MKPKEKWEKRFEIKIGEFLKIVDADNSTSAYSVIKDFIRSLLNQEREKEFKKGQDFVLLWIKKTGEKWRQEPIMSCVKEIEDRVALFQREKLISQIEEWDSKNYPNELYHHNLISFIKSIK